MFWKKEERSKNRPSIRKNRMGIPVFDRGEDLYALFTGKAEAMKKTEAEELEDGAPSREPGSLGEDSFSNSEPDKARGSRFDSSAGRNRHGLPILDGSRSLASIFSESREEEDFASLLESSLKGKGADEMMREKRDRARPSPVPLKKRLKRYPPPQLVLDLHGFTAARAESRAESFLRAEWRKGTFTVRIVVGRGLHSENGAVLPDVVEALLIKLKREGVVLWFEWDRRHKALSGSVIAFIKQFPT